MSHSNLIKETAPAHLVRCGKNELLINIGHVGIIVTLPIIGTLISQEVQYLALYFIFSLYIMLVLRIRASGPVHLDLVFLAFLFIYSFSVPLSNALSQHAVDSDIVASAAEICMLAYIGFSIGMLLDTGRNRRIAPLSSIDAPSAKIMRHAGLLVFSIGAIVSFLAIALTAGWPAYLSAGYAGRALLKQEVGPIELGLYFSIVGLFAVFTSTLLSDRAKPISKLFVILAFLFFFIYVSFLGIRRPLFLLGLGLLTGYSVIRHRPKLRTALPLGVIVFVFLATFAQYRHLTSSTSLLEILDFIRANASIEWLDVSKSELGAPFRSLIDHINADTTGDGLLLGASYLQTFLYALPRFITGDLQSLSVQYTRSFFSDAFISIGGNMGFFPVTEAFLNFGRVGVFAIFGLLGFGISQANRWFHGAGRSQIWNIVMFMILVPWTAFFMRLDLASVTKGFLYSQVVPFVILLLIFWCYKRLRGSKV